MSRSTKDPLLNVASVILALGVVLFIFVAAMVLIGLGAVLTVQRAELLARLAEAGAPDSAYWAIVVVLVLVEALMIIALRFVLELSERIDLTLANVSILKTGKAKAIRFSTLAAICRELDCQPGDLLGYDRE